MTRRREKHLAYHRLLEALGTARSCPLCELEAHDVHRYLEGLLYESVNDVAVRAELVRSRGYCARHAHQLAAFADGLGTAILYGDQVRVFLEFLGGSGELLGGRRRLAQSTWNDPARCPACAFQWECRKGYVATLLAWLTDEPLRAALAQSPGLCAPHLLAALREVREIDHRRDLIALHREKYSALAADLAEFVRKTDHRYRDEPVGREADSWRRAVNMMAGHPDLF